MRIATLLAFFCTFLLAHAQQNEKLEKLEQFLVQCPPDTTKLKTYSELINSYTYTNPTRAVELCNQMLALADSLNNKTYIAIAQKSRGNQYFLQGDYADAMDKYLVALRIMEENGEKNETAGLLHNIGMIYIKWENADEALAYLKRALEINLASNKQVWLMNNYQAIGVVHADLLHQPDSAIFYHTKSMERSQELGYTQGQIGSYLNIGSAYFQKLDFENAKKYYNKALRLDDSTNNKTYQGIIQEKLGVIAMEFSQWKTAEKHLLVAIDYFQSKQKLQELSGAYQNVAVTYFNQKEFKDAYHYLMLSRRLKDSIFSESSKTKIANLEANYLMITKNKELEIANRDKIIAEQNLERESLLKQRWVGVSIGAAILAFLVIFGWAQNRKHLQIIADKNDELAKVNEQLSESVNEKNSILNIVAHDLRAPLAKIRAIADLVSLDKNLSTETQTKLNRIEGHVLSSNRLIQDLIEAQREEESHKNLLHESILPNELLSKIIAEHEVAAKEKEISLYVESSKAPFITDAYRLTRIIENLVSNAIKFSPPKTIVSIATESTEDALKITIADQGPGFNEQDKSLLFKKFQPLSAQPTGNESSVGLGLSIVKRMVNELKGTINLVSSHGHGTTFIISLPQL